MSHDARILRREPVSRQSLRDFADAGSLRAVSGLGIFFAMPALVLGIMGLRKRAKNPEVKGSVHAWIGIVLGGLFTLIWGAAWGLFIIESIAQSQGW